MKFKTILAVFAVFLVLAVCIGICTAEDQPGVNDFVGKMEGAWEYTGSRNVSPQKWNTAITVSESGGKIMVVYSEGECAPLLTEARTYPPVEGTISDGVLSFVLTNPRTGNNRIIKVKKLEGAEFEASGRIPNWVGGARLHKK